MKGIILFFTLAFALLAGGVFVYETQIAAPRADAISKTKKDIKRQTPPANNELLASNTTTNDPVLTESNQQPPRLDMSVRPIVRPSSDDSLDNTVGEKVALIETTNHTRSGMLEFPTQTTITANHHLPKKKTRIIDLNQPNTFDAKNDLEEQEALLESLNESIQKTIQESISLDIQKAVAAEISRKEN